MTTIVERLRMARRASFVTVFLGFASGCTTITEQIVGTEREDITPFAQKTVEVLGVENMRLYDSELVYLRVYADDPDFVELDRLQGLLAQTEAFRDHVISYAVDLVRITELYTEDSDKVAAYVDGINDQLRDQVVGQLEMTNEEWDRMITEIRKQQEFLAALRTFQPVINAAGKFYQELLSEIESVLLIDVRSGFDERIQSEFAVVIEYLDNHFRRRDAILTGLNLVDAYRRGDLEASEGLRDGNIVFDPTLLPKNRFSAQDVDAIDSYLRTELEKSTLVLDQLEQDVDDYEKTRDELDRVEAEVIADLSIARLQFLTWSRAHQALANGVKEPGNWMELSIRATQLLRRPIR